MKKMTIALGLANLGGLGGFFVAGIMLDNWDLGIIIGTIIMCALANHASILLTRNEIIEEIRR